MLGLFSWCFSWLISVFLVIFLFYYLPFKKFLRGVPPLTEKEFREDHPSKAPSVIVWSRIAFVILAILTIIFILSQVSDYTQTHTKQKIKNWLIGTLFFILIFPTFFAGPYLSVALIEIITGVSIIIPFGHGGPRPDRTRYYVSPRARLVGVYRLLLAIIIFATFYILAHWEG